MRMSDRKSAEGYIKDAKAKFKKGNVLKEVISNSAEETINLVKQANPELVKAAVNYIKYAERLVKSGYTPSQSGYTEESSEEREALQKAFTLDTAKKVRIFQPEWWETAQELFIYHLIEAVFDASLLIEQGAARKFTELVDLHKSFMTIEEVDGWSFAYYGKTVLFIDTNRGRICSVSSRVVRDAIGKSPIKKIERKREGKHLLYALVLKNNKKFLLMSDQKLTPCMWKVENSVKDTHKEYLQVYLKDRDETTDTPMVRFPVHIILLLAQYGINPIKHTILKDSLITCDHINMQPKQNQIDNLALVTRRDNRLRAAAKDPIVKQTVCSYDLIQFWKHVESSFRMNKIDVKMQKEALTDYWTPILNTKSAEEILAV